MTTQSAAITIEPIVSYPREAEPGKTYLMTVDLRFPVDAEKWPYDEEEHEIYCLLDTAPLFDNEALGESAIVLHRFGGTYGPAMFLLTANQIEMSDPVGSITLTLANRHLMPLQVFKLDKIRISKNAATSSETVKVTRQQSTLSGNIQIKSTQEQSPTSAQTETELPEVEKLSAEQTLPNPPLDLPAGIKRLHIIPALSPVEQIAWSPDGKTLAFTADNPVIHLWDAEAKQIRTEALQLPAKVKRLAWSPDSLSLAAALTENQVWVGHVSLLGSPVLLRFQAELNDLQWSPDRRWLAIASQDGAIYVRDTRIWRDSGTAMREFDTFPRSIAWSPAGASYLVAGYTNGYVITWDTKTWEKRRIYHGHNSAVNCITISPSRVFIASGADDGSIRIFRIDTTDDDYRFVLGEHTAAVKNVCFSHDGKLLASASDDGTVRLWESPSWKCVAVIDASTAASEQPLPLPSVLAFHPKEFLLATCLSATSAISVLELDQQEISYMDSIQDMPQGKEPHQSKSHSSSTTADCWVRVRILGPQDTDGCYRVEVEMDDGRWFHHKMRLGDDEEITLIAIPLGDTRAYGVRLYQLLFSNSDNPEDELNMREALQNAWGRAIGSQSGQLRVQLWISEECHELHRFRWERLFVPLENQWRALANFDRTPFSRFTRLPLRDPRPGASDLPLKVLFAISNPQDLTDLSGELAEVEVEKEIKCFYEAVKDFPEVFVTFLPGRTGIKDEGLLSALAPPRFRIINNESTSIKLIQREFANHHILHFVGHGIFERGKQWLQPDSTIEEPREQSKRTMCLVLEDSTGKAVKVEDVSIVHNLIQLVDNQLPRLIFLWPCDMSRYDERNPRAFNSLAPKLVEAGFPAVVTMQDKVPVDVASEFTRNFYGNLLKDGVIDSALNRTRWFLYDGLKLLDNWTIPVLFMRTPRGSLFDFDREQNSYSNKQS